MTYKTDDTPMWQVRGRAMLEHFRRILERPEQVFDILELLEIQEQAVSILNQTNAALGMHFAVDQALVKRARTDFEIPVKELAERAIAFFCRHHSVDLEELQGDRRSSHLRELRISLLCLLVETGLSNREVAEWLGRSEEQMQNAYRQHGATRMMDSAQMLRQVKHVLLREKLST